MREEEGDGGRSEPVGVERGVSGWGWKGVALDHGMEELERVWGMRV